jgi:ribosomal protein S27E
VSQLRGLCPGCNNEFVYDEKTTSVYCDFCHEAKPVSTLKPVGGAKKADKGHTGAVPAAAMQGFDNPESGIVFMANYFDTMDWSDYKSSPKIEIADLQE